jgi:hypothetical protein
MKTQHTPGPWVADGYNVKQPRGRYIAYTGPSHTPEDIYPKSCAMEDKANANLIAAAPDLLAALEELLYGHTDKAECMASAAIAKAKGEAP